MMNQSKNVLTVGLLSAALMLTACSKGASTFSLLGDSNSFKQNDSSINGKIDILWVVDNSGSMKTSQDKVAANFEGFINQLRDKGYDYQVAVITSDAYRAQTKYNRPSDGYNAYAGAATFRNGNAIQGPSGYTIISPAIPDADLNRVFMQNIQQGTGGNGDERGLESFMVALDHASNASFNFPRQDAFLAIIILSDEEDYSHTGTGMKEDLNNPDLYPISHFVSYLDQRLQATAADRSSKYNVNTLSIMDQACLDEQRPYNSQKISVRYKAMAEATGGVAASMCSDFGATLNNISSKIIELRTKFYLAGEPNVNSIRVTIDGVQITRLNDGNGDGFLYHPEDNSITFHGTAVPGPGSAISVNFDPNGLK